MPLVTESIRTTKRSEMIEITDLVERLVRDAGIKDGLAVVHVPHTTAAVTINENADPDVKHDMLRKLSELIPKSEAYYRHAEGNSDSHVKTSLVGNAVTLPIDNGRLTLGQWQGIQFCEFDGPRTRQIWVKLVNFAPKP
jgi:secondary thiamine-phosphate synthase enzyme